MSASAQSLPGKISGDRPDIIDGFVLSLTQLLLPINYRAITLGQMDTLRRANGYQFAAFTAPSQAPKTVPAFGQIEEQWSVVPGSYLWGWYLTLLSGSSQLIHVLITDACTETALFSDYITAGVMGNTSVRHPFLLAQPRLISDPGKINVELYNNSSSAVSAQLACYFAQPILPPPGVNERMR